VPQVREEGGHSRLVSSVTLFDEIQRPAPRPAAGALPRLPDGSPRRGAAGNEAMVRQFPCSIGTRDSSTTIYVGQYIRSAQDNYPGARRLTAKEWESAGIPRQPHQRSALNLQMTMVPGDMQFVHNHPGAAFAHRLRGLARAERKRTCCAVDRAARRAAPAPSASRRATAA